MAPNDLVGLRHALHVVFDSRRKTAEPCAYRGLRIFASYLYAPLISASVWSLKTCGD